MLAALLGACGGSGGGGSVGPPTPAPGPTATPAPGTPVIRGRLHRPDRARCPHDRLHRAVAADGLRLEQRVPGDGGLAGGGADRHLARAPAQLVVLPHLQRGLRLGPRRRHHRQRDAHARGRTRDAARSALDLDARAPRAGAARGREQSLHGPPRPAQPAARPHGRALAGRVRRARHVRLLPGTPARAEGRPQQLRGLAAVPGRGLQPHAGLRGVPRDAERRARPHPARPDHDRRRWGAAAGPGRGERRRHLRSRAGAAQPPRSQRGPAVGLPLRESRAPVHGLQRPQLAGDEQPVLLLGVPAARDRARALPDRRIRLLGVPRHQRQPRGHHRERATDRRQRLHAWVADHQQRRPGACCCTMPPTRGS